MEYLLWAAVIIALVWIGSGLVTNWLFCGKPFDKQAAHDNMKTIVNHFLKDESE